MLISIACLLIGWNQIAVLFNLDSTEFKQQKADDELRVMSWNVKSFQGITADNKLKKSNAENIFALIDSMDADIVCFQEFGQYDSPTVKRNYVAEMKKIGFQHFVQSKDYNRSGPWGFSNGLAIFSKIPFIATKRIAFSSSPESVLYADVPYNGDTVRIFTTHLQSFKFSGDDYRNIERIKSQKDSIYEASFNILAKMKRAFRNRGAQADMVRPLLDSCPHPEIITCDMNDVPSSYAYWQLKGDRNDAFLEKGFGIGRTFIALAPTLRIDYILADKNFEVNQFKVGKERYSDHLPLIADVKLSKQH